MSSKTEFTNEEMLNELREFYRLNNRRPYMRDFKDKKPSADMISNRFGKWSKAIELAGIPHGKLRDTDYDKEYLINCMLSYYKETNKIPTIRGMISKGYPTAHAFINHFGSFKNALKESGLYELRKDKHQFTKTYTKEEMLENLKKYMENKDRIPVHSVIKEELKNPSISTYERHFYSIFNALKLIGYDYEEQKEKDLIELENDMIDKYKKLKERLGRVPSSRDIDYYCKTEESIYSMKSYEFHFGSLSELQRLCGFVPTVVGKSKTKEDLLNDLRMIAKEIGKTPSRLDLKYFEDVASDSTYRHTFGSWNDAIREAGLKPNDKICYSIKGTKCLSYYELLFANMLDTYNIDYIKEKMYRDYLATNRKFRFDFVVEYKDINYFIEIFGITGSEDYDNKAHLKMQLCKEYNLPLITFYPEDFQSFKLEDIYNMLEYKIKTIYN